MYYVKQKINVFFLQNIHFLDEKVRISLKSQILAMVQVPQVEQKMSRIIFSKNLDFLI